MYRTNLYEAKLCLSAVFKLTIVYFNILLNNIFYTRQVNTHFIYKYNLNYIPILISHNYGISYIIVDSYRYSLLITIFCFIFFHPSAE